MNKRTKPDMEASISNLHRELVRRAELEKQERRIRGEAPRLDQDPVDAAISYFEMRGASNVVPPVQSAAVEHRQYDMKLLEPCPEDTNMMIACALSGLAIYQTQERDLETTRAKHESVRVICSAIRQLRESERLPTPEVRSDFRWLVHGKRVSSEAEDAYLAELEKYQKRIDSVLYSNPFWKLSHDCRQHKALCNTRLLLLVADDLSNRQIAELLVDASDAMSRRVGRVRTARMEERAKGGVSARRLMANNPLTVVKCAAARPSKIFVRLGRVRGSAVASRR